MWTKELPNNVKIAVAVSGGADSVALLDRLVCVAEEIKQYIDTFEVGMNEKMIEDYASLYRALRRVGVLDGRLFLCADLFIYTFFIKI